VFPSALGPLSSVLLIAAVAALLALVGAGLWLRADFVIKRRSGGRVLVSGRIAAAKVGAIKEFFRRDLDTPHAVTVRGSYGPGRRLRLRFSGRLSPAERQRIRNFLIAHLR
jgi:hypothetical protein